MTLEPKFGVMWWLILEGADLGELGDEKEGLAMSVVSYKTSYERLLYALTKNPTIYVSLIQQFWQTSTTRTLDNGEMEITATIDGKVKVVIEASVRRHLKLEDSDGLYWGGHSIVPRNDCSGPIFSSSPTHTHVSNEAAATCVDVKHRGAATTVTSSDAGQGSGNIDKTPSMPHDSCLLTVNTLRSDEGKMQHNELMDMVTKLLDRVLALEADLKQTKKVYDVAYTKIIIKTYTRKRAFSTGSGRVSTASKMISTTEESVSTVGASMPISIVGMVDKAQSFIEEEWENIRARVEADEELTQNFKQRKGTKLFEATIRIIKKFVPMESDDGKAVPKLPEARSSKRDAREELDQGRSKKQKIGKRSEPRNKDADELSQEEL
nr:hypothetical protein [Tanacetum cinerariifolium]